MRSMSNQTHAITRVDQYTKLVHPDAAVCYDRDVAAIYPQDEYLDRLMKNSVHDPPLWTLYRGMILGGEKTMVFVWQENPVPHWSRIR